MEKEIAVLLCCELSALRADLDNFGHRFSQIYTDNIIVHKFKNLCSSVFIRVPKWKFLYYRVT